MSASMEVCDSPAPHGMKEICEYLESVANVSKSLNAFNIPTISAGSTTTNPNDHSTSNDNSNLGKDFLSLAVRPRKIVFNGSVWKPSSSAFAPVSRNTTPNNNSNSKSPTSVTNRETVPTPKVINRNSELKPQSPSFNCDDINSDDGSDTDQQVPRSKSVPTTMNTCDTSPTQHHRKTFTPEMASSTRPRTPFSPVPSPRQSQFTTPSPSLNGSDVDISEDDFETDTDDDDEQIQTENDYNNTQVGDRINPPTYRDHMTNVNNNVVNQNHPYYQSTNDLLKVSLLHSSTNVSKSSRRHLNSPSSSFSSPTSSTASAPSSSCSHSPFYQYGYMYNEIISKKSKHSLEYSTFGDGWWQIQHQQHENLQSSTSTQQPRQPRKLDLPDSPRRSKRSKQN